MTHGFVISLLGRVLLRGVEGVEDDGEEEVDHEKAAEDEPQVVYPEFPPQKSPPGLDTPDQTLRYGLAMTIARKTKEKGRRPLHTTYRSIKAGSYSRFSLFIHVYSTL